MFERATAWVQTPGNITLRCTGWGPAMLKEIWKVARDLPPVGGKGLVPFAPLAGNMVPLVMLHQIATAKEAESKSESVHDGPVASTGVQGKSKRAAAFLGGKRKKKKSTPSPYSSWSGTRMGAGRAWGQGGEVKGFPPP